MQTADTKNILYLYDLPKESTTSQKIAKIVKDLADYDLGANPPQIRRDPNRLFYSAVIKINDPAKFNEVAHKLRTFEIDGKCCRALPFDKAFLGTNRQQLKDYTVFLKFDRNAKDVEVKSTGDLYKYAEENIAKGSVKSAKISINPDHSSRGYGFVTFTDPQVAKQATQNELKGVYQVAPYQQKDRSKKAFNNIYVKNFPEGWNEENLKGLFSKYGPIKSIALKKFKLPHEEKESPFAFICFEDDSQNKDKEVGIRAAHAAIDDLNGKEFEGKQLYVKEALKKEVREAEKLKEQLRFKQSKKRCNLYVKNFPQNTKKEELLELFSKNGQIESLKMMPREEEALYAFVCYASADQAASAKQQLNGFTFNGKQLYVNHYELKEVRKLQQEEIRDKADYQNFNKQNPQNITFDLLNKPEIFQLIQFLMGHIQRQQPFRGGMYNKGPRQGQQRFNQPGQMPRPQPGQMPPAQPPQMMPPQPQPMMMPPQQVPPQVPPMGMGQVPPQIMEYNMNGRKLVPAVVPQNPNYKTQVGEFIYEYVEQISGEEKAPKITGMLIDLPIPEIQSYLIDFGKLQFKIQEANQLLSSGQQ